MIIKFNSIRLSNFMSFNDETVKLDDLGYTLVSGRNEAVEDSALSNGSGKSSLWEGIVWALTGETIRGNKNVVNIFGNDGAVVALDFDVDSNHFTIQRSKDHSKLKSSLTIFLNGTDVSGKGIRDSEAILKQYLPDLTSSLLSSVIILGQGLPQRFSNNTPSGRKQVLEELSKSDFMIEDLKQRICSRKTVLSDSVQDIQKKALSETTKRDIFAKQLQEAKEKLSSYSDDNIHSFEKDVLDLQKEKEQVEDRLEKLSKIIDSKQKDISALHEEFYAKKSESTSKVAEVTSKYSEKLTEVTVKISSLQLKETLEKKELSRLESITDVCPTCGQKLVGVTKPDTTSIKESIEQIREELQKLNSEKVSITNDKQKEQQEVEASFSEVLKEIQRKKDVLCEELEEEERNNRSLLSEREHVYKSLQEAEYFLSAAEAERKNIEQKIKDLVSQIETTEAQLLYYNNEEEDTKNHLAVVNKMETVVKRDFRGCLLKNVIDFINNRAKIYSEVVFGNNLIDFKQEGNNISISFDNKEYESLSGGEQKKLDVIIQLAIRDMLCRLMNFSSNILVCDEIFDALDITGCQKIIDLVSTNLEDVSSVFIVTHRDNLCIPCDNQITVVKDVNKISHVIQET